MNFNIEHTLIEYALNLIHSRGNVFYFLAPEIIDRSIFLLFSAYA